VRPRILFEEDIDRNAEYDCDQIDTLVFTVSNHLCGAINSSQLNARPKRLLNSLCDVQVQTHKTIRGLLRFESDSFAPKTAALSLVREQLEAFFLLLFVLDNPDDRASHFMKYNWRRYYEFYLLEKTEMGGLESWKDYLRTKAPDFLKKIAYQAGVTEEEQEREDKIFGGSASKRDRLITDFPTPGRIVQQISCPRTRRLGEAWLPEWHRYCGLVHVHVPKLMNLEVENSLWRLSPGDAVGYLQNTYGVAIVLSWLAIACSAAEIFHSTQNIDLMASLDKLWRKLREISLLARLFWEAGIKEAMPATIDC